MIYTSEDRAAKVPEREATKALAEGRAENERWHLRQDGTRFWASGLVMPLRDPQGVEDVVAAHRGEAVGLCVADPKRSAHDGSHGTTA